MAGMARREPAKKDSITRTKGGGGGDQVERGQNHPIVNGKSAGREREGVSCPGSGSFSRG